MKADVTVAPLRDRPFFAVSVGTKVQSKEWGIRNWTRLLGVVAEQYPGHALLLAGAAEEKYLSEEAATAWLRVPGAGPVLNVCGQLSPRESAAAFRGAVAFLGHDSGPMHLAAAVNTPVLAIFAARNKPRTWFPICAKSCVLYHRVDCWGCELETCVEQRKKCILSISVQEALQGLRGLLEDTYTSTGKTERA